MRVTKSEPQETFDGLKQSSMIWIQSVKEAVKDYSKTLATVSDFTLKVSSVMSQTLATYWI